MIVSIIYLTAVLTFSSGLYIVMTSDSYFRKMIGLNVVQSGVLIFYIALSKIANGIPPILECLEYDKCPIEYSNPLPHVLMLTAIVVGLATLSIGLALIYRIYENFGTHNESEINVEKYDPYSN